MPPVKLDLAKGEKLTLGVIRRMKRAMRAAGAVDVEWFVVDVPRAEVMDVGGLEGFVPARKYGPWGRETALPNEIGAVESCRITCNEVPQEGSGLAVHGGGSGG
jgi:hypothetical protein